MLHQAAPWWPLLFGSMRQERSSFKVIHWAWKAMTGFAMLGHIWTLSNGQCNSRLFDRNPSWSRLTIPAWAPSRSTTKQTKQDCVKNMEPIFRFRFALRCGFDGQFHKNWQQPSSNNMGRIIRAKLLLNLLCASISSQWDESPGIIIDFNLFPTERCKLSQARNQSSHFSELSPDAENVQISCSEEPMPKHICARCINHHLLERRRYASLFEAKITPWRLCIHF